MTLLRKDKLMNGVSWSMRFQQALCTWPCISDLGAGAAQVCVAHLTRAYDHGSIMSTFNEQFFQHVLFGAKVLQLGQYHQSYNLNCVVKLRCKYRMALFLLCANISEIEGTKCTPNSQTKP